jgi:hypothetical protein
MKNIPLLSIFAITLIFLLSSCGDKSMTTSFGTSILDTMSNDKLLGNTRAAHFEDKEDKKKVTFTIIYNGNLKEMASNDNSLFKAMLEAYGFQMQKPFEIDEKNKGIVLVPSSPLKSPIEVGKAISLIDEVLMVQVTNVNKSEGSVS